MDSDGGGSNVGGFLGHHRSGPQSPAQQREGLRFHPPLTPPSGSNPHTPASPHTTNISQVDCLTNVNIHIICKLFGCDYKNIFFFLRPVNIKVSEAVPQHRLI